MNSKEAGGRKAPGGLRMSIATLSTLALAVWKHALTDRGAHLLIVLARLERALGVTGDPEAISLACRELVRAGYAERSAFGYRARQVRQGELLGKGDAA